MVIIKKFRIKSFKNIEPLLEVKNISISFETRKILDNISFTDLKLIIKKTDLLIACHGSPAHIASSFNTKIIDIFDQKNEEFYKFYTNHLRNYKYLYREDFTILAKNILQLV